METLEILFNDIHIFYVFHSVLCFGTLRLRRLNRQLQVSSYSPLNLKLNPDTTLITAVSTTLAEPVLAKVID